MGHPALVLIEAGIIMTLVTGGLWLLARRMRAVGSASARSTRLTATHAMHVVDVEGRRLVVGTGPSGAPRLLCELEPTAVRPPTGRVVADRPQWRDD